MHTYRVDFHLLPWEEPIPGVRHQFLDQKGKRLRLVEYTREMKPHWCTRGHVGIILEGRFEIRFADSVGVFNPGDGVFIPSGEEHRHMAVALTERVRALFVEESQA